MNNPITDEVLTKIANKLQADPEAQYNSRISANWQTQASSALNKIFSIDKPTYNDYLEFVVGLLGQGTTTGNLKYRVDIEGKFKDEGFVPVKFLNPDAIGHLIGTAGINIITIIYIQYNDIRSLYPGVVINEIYKLYQVMYRILEISLRHYLDNYLEGKSPNLDLDIFLESYSQIYSKAIDFKESIENIIKTLREKIYDVNFENQYVGNTEIEFSSILILAEFQEFLDKRKSLIPIYETVDTNPDDRQKYFFEELRYYIGHLRNIHRVPNSYIKEIIGNLMISFRRFLDKEIPQAEAKAKALNSLRIRESNLLQSLSEQ